MDALKTTTSDPPVGDGWVGLLRDLARCGRLAQRALAARLGERLSLSQAALLWACREMAASDPSQLELARHLGMSPAQVSGIVETLRTDGFIESRRSPSDRRRQTWRLTITGQQALSEIDQQLAGWSTPCCKAFGKDALDEISRLLITLEPLLNPPHTDQTLTLVADTSRREAAA